MGLCRAPHPPLTWRRPRGSQALAPSTAYTSSSAASGATIWMRRAAHGGHRLARAPLHLFGERDGAGWAESSAAPGALGFLYVALHFAAQLPCSSGFIATAPAVPVPAHDAVVRPPCAGRLRPLPCRSAAPRRSRLRRHRQHAHGAEPQLGPLGSLYNPIAAVPSLHFGYALIVGVAIAGSPTGAPPACWAPPIPSLMLLIIVGTGNHFFFDAAAGGLVVVVGWLVALAAHVRPAVARGAPPPPPARREAWTPHSARGSRRRAA